MNPKLDDMEHEKKETISYEEFQKLDIRVGTIISAEVVPDTDKLLKLMVDVGESESRQIISGIREYVPDPESIVGTQTTFVVNLEPRTIRGLESVGMLFAVSGNFNNRILFADQITWPDAPLRSVNYTKDSVKVGFMVVEHADYKIDEYTVSKSDGKEPRTDRRTDPYHSQAAGTVDERDPSPGPGRVDQSVRS